MRDHVRDSATVRRVLESAIASRTFPAAVAEVGDHRQILWRESLGTLTFEADAPSADEDTIFDLASLTKPIATTTLAMHLVARGLLDLAEPVANAFPEWRGADRAGVTVRDLLEHASGLAARLVDQSPSSRREFEHEICTMPLEYAPRQKSVYSDLGFILLGLLIADRGGDSLQAQFEHVSRAFHDSCDSREAGAGGAGSADAGDALLGFGVPASLRDRVAPTWPLDDDWRRGRMLTGEVHDNYAASLGGAAAHAGLFGSAGGVGCFAREILAAVLGHDASGAGMPASLVRDAIQKSDVPGSSRALGWDTMLTTSSCGIRMSAAAFGHVGFTGTSLWIDPEADRYFVLLTNRACAGGTLDEMRDVRRAFHDAAVHAFTGHQGAKTRN